MRLKTRLFELEGHRYNQTQLATMLNLSTAQLSRVKTGNRGINECFIVGTLLAFSQYSFDDLFYIDKEAL